MLTHPMIDPVFLHLGPFALHWYGLMYGVSIFLGFKWASPYLKNTLGMSFDTMLTLMSYIVFSILIGGRLGYIVIYNAAYYWHNPLQIFAVWEGGMSYHGAGIACIIGILCFAYRYRYPFWGLLDYLALGATLGVALGRIGNFINGELYGRLSTVPWAMVFPDGGPFPRHPSQLYESFFEGVLLGLCLWSLKRYLKLKPGLIFSFYLVGYGGVRFILEFFREPDMRLGFVLKALTMGQLLCMVMVLGGVLTAVYHYRKGLFR